MLLEKPIAPSVVKAGVLGRLVAITGSAMFFKPDHCFTDAPGVAKPVAGRSC